ncbi:MAG: VWA-like domain-containing protein, partial [Candidatus Riflebacteria bacterium]
MDKAANFDLLCRTERERLAALRFQLLESHPFWGYMLLQTRLVFEPDLPTFAATDGFKHIWFNPVMTSRLNIRQLGFILVHEVCHSVFASFQRRGNRDLHLWNCATDYAINRIISKITHHGSWNGKPLYEMPVLKNRDGEQTLLYNPDYEDWTAEMIYEKLAKDELTNPTQIILKLKMPGLNGSEDEKDGENQAPDEIEIPNVQNHGGGLDIHVPIELTPAQKEELFDRIRAAAETWRKSGSRGNAPEEIIRHISGSEKSRVPWNRLLRQYAAQSLAKEDYSLARPNRRYLNQNMVVPGLYSESVCSVIISLDTSGSVDSELLSHAMAEISKISDLVEEVLLIVCDCQIHETVPTGNLPKYIREMKVKGGGGTSHLPVFDYIARKHIEPDLFIGITDLESFFPEKRPAFPVLWLVPYGVTKKAPWGRII